MDKNTIRSIIKNKLTLLTKEYCIKADKVICDKVLSMAEYKNAKTIFCYVGREDEIDTRIIIENALENGKIVTVPKCIDDKNMIACEIKGFDDLEVCRYGILEPKKDCKIVTPNEIDLGIIPCVTCDENGNRIGYGKGYYDRYLSKTEFTTVVLCRKELMSEKIIPDENDVKIDIVITD